MVSPSSGRYCSKTSENIQRTARCHIPEDRNLHGHCSENRKSRVWTAFATVSRENWFSWWAMLLCHTGKREVYREQSIVLLEKINLEILTDLHVSSRPEYENVVLVLLCVHLCTWLVPVRLDGCYSHSRVHPLLVGALLIRTFQLQK
jgi:hypothetical protein